MLTAADIRPGARLAGLAGTGVAEVIQAPSAGLHALNVVFRIDGRIDERLVYPESEPVLSGAESGRAFAFDADGAQLRLASEALRIRLAHLFAPYLAISSSQIENLPHQIAAAYGTMLEQRPLRLLLADDPGADKTIMAGLLVKELMIRGDVARCLVVALGSLVDQWQEELADKFGLAFDLMTRDQIEASLTASPIDERSSDSLRPG